MNYKEQMKKLLSELKTKNHSRRKIENYLGYAPKALDQLLSKGGNESIVIKLKAYKEDVDAGRITMHEDGAENYAAKDVLIKSLQQTIESKDMLIAYLQKEIEMLMKEKVNNKDSKFDTTSSVYKKKTV